MVNLFLSISYPPTPIPILLIDSLKLYKPAHLCDDHPFCNGRAARERGLISVLRLTLKANPDLAVGAFAVPAEIPVRYGLHGKKLEAAQQLVILWHFDALAQDFHFNQF